MKRAGRASSSAFVLWFCGSAVAAWAQPQPGAIIVGNNVTNTILAVNPVIGAQTLVSSGGSLCSPHGLAVDSAGRILVASACSQEVLRIDPASGAQTVVSSGGHLSYPTGLALEPDGSIIVGNYGVACPPGGNTIIRINPSTGAQTVVSSGGNLVCPTDLAIASNGGIFVTSQITSTVVRVDPVTGAQTVISSGGMLNAPAGIVFDAGGSIIVGNGSANAILRIDPATGAQTVVSSGGSLAHPAGVAIDDAGSIVASNYLGNTVVRVNPSTGVQTLVSAGGSLNYPTRMTILAVAATNPQRVLTFDDVPSNGPNSFVLPGYGGFNWDGGWGLESDSSYTGPGGGNSYGSPSGAYAASNGLSASLWRSIESPPGSCCIREPFDFIGASFSSLTVNDQINQNSAISMVVEGYRAGDLVGSIAFPLVAGYTWHEVNLRNIDELRLLPEGSSFGSFERFLMDDFTFSAASNVPVNTAPTASAGNNQVVRSGEIVHLDGSASFDDNTPTNQLLFSWSLVSRPSGSAVTLSGADTIAPTFVPDLAGTYLVQLVVTDQEGLPSAASQATIGGNPPPTADAGPDQLVIVGSPVILTGAGADPDGDPLSYAWALTGTPAGSSASLSSPGSSTTTLVPDLPGVFTARLTVLDAFGPGVPDLVQITATTAAGYAEIQVQAASLEVLALPASAVTNRGNQNALTQHLSNAVVALQTGGTSARAHLEQALSRTDGCALRGTPDGNGPGRDWITSCGEQAPVYESLMAALAAITP